MTDKQNIGDIAQQNKALYAAQAKEVPPKHIDDDILKLARSQAKLYRAGAMSSSNNEFTETKQAGNNIDRASSSYSKWRSRVLPISSAASVLIVVGVLIINDSTRPVAELQQPVADMPTANGMQMLDSETGNPSEIASVASADVGSLVEDKGSEPRVMSSSSSGVNQVTANQSLAKRAVPKAARSTAMLAQSKPEAFTDKAGSSSNIEGLNAVERVNINSLSAIELNHQLAKTLAKDLPSLDTLLDMLALSIKEDQLGDALSIEQHILKQFQNTAEMTPLQRASFKTLAQTLLIKVQAVEDNRLQQSPKG